MDKYQMDRALDRAVGKLNAASRAALRFVRRMLMPVNRPEGSC